MKITKQFLKKKSACSDGISWCEENKLIGLPAKKFLNKLIEACGDGFEDLVKVHNSWICNIDDSGVHPMAEYTPEEAVANLWLELNKEKQK